MFHTFISVYNNHRPLFKDGWNSVFHILFGVLAAYYSIIIPLFIAYQLLTIYDKNTWIDITEFFIGYICTLLYKC